MAAIVGVVAAVVIVVLALLFYLATGARARTPSLAEGGRPRPKKKPRHPRTEGID